MPATSRHRLSASTYEDPLSPSFEEADMSFPPSCDASFSADSEVIPSIEPLVITSPASPTLSSSNYTRYTRRSSAISDLPSELSVHTKETSPFAPMKHRPAFHTTNSVRALQMASPSISPYEGYTSPPKKRNSIDYMMSTPSRRPGSISAQSQREGSVKGSKSGSPAPELTSSKMSSRHSAMGAKDQYPLVLLHATLLPVCPPFQASVMEAVLPEHILENYRLLEDKMADSLLMQRGILVPHPREEYELLEERLLESLDLKSPRILKCGHFYAEEDKGRESVLDDHRYVERRDSGSHADAYSEQSTIVDTIDEYDDADLCAECDQPIKHDDMGAGSGNRRWDIKIYAANGLMRAGAWSAAWTEMERVDVEITPWIPEDLRRAMERRRVEEEHEEKCRLVEAEESRMRELQDAEKRRQKELRDAEERARVEAKVAAEQRLHEAEDAAKMEKDEREARAEVEKLRMIGAAAIAADAARKRAEDTLRETLEEERRNLEKRVDGQMNMEQARRPKATAQIPLSVLLQNYMYLLAKDRRNWALAILSFLVVYLALRPESRYQQVDLAPMINYPVANLSAPLDSFDVGDSHTITIHPVTEAEPVATAHDSNMDAVASSEKPTIEEAVEGSIVVAESEPDKSIDAVKTTEDSIESLAEDLSQPPMNIENVAIPEALLDGHISNADTETEHVPISNDRGNAVEKVTVSNLKDVEEVERLGLDPDLGTSEALSIAVAASEESSERVSVGAE